jgi:hypothetical protein
VFGIARRKTHRQLVRSELGESLDHFVRAATHAAGGVGASVGPRVETARDYVAPAAERVRSTATDGWQSTMAAFAPLAAAAAERARHAGSATQKASSKRIPMMGKKQSRGTRKRWSFLTGLLVAGAAAGAVGAVLVRRRQQPDWESYDPGSTLEPVRGDTEVLIANSPSDAARPGNGKATPAEPEKTKAAGPDNKAKAGTAEKASGSAEKAKDRTAATGERISSTTSAITDSAKQTAAKSTDKADGLLGAAPTPAPSRNSRG